MSSCKFGDSLLISNKTYTRAGFKVTRIYCDQEFIPVVDDLKEEFHRNHGQLGYVYKDQRPHPQWRLAEAELSRAIQIRDKQNVGGFLMYELNRAVCNIHLQAGFETIKSDLDKVLRLGPDNGRWVRRLHPTKCTAVIDWIRQNQARLQEWLTQNDIQLPESNGDTITG